MGRQYEYGDNGDVIVIDHSDEKGWEVTYYDYGLFPGMTRITQFEYEIKELIDQLEADPGVHLLLN